MEHTVIRSKMKKALPLMNDSMISDYVPKTDWLHASSLQNMLSTYPIVYIKPDVGRRGNGIIRIRRLNSSQSEISFRQTTVRCPSNAVYLEIMRRLRSNKKYIIQQGIDLATYHQRPFDVRVVLQKAMNKWRATLMCARVASSKSSVVTNIAKGAKDFNIYRTLRGIDQPLNKFDVLRDLLDISHQIAQILDSHFPLKIVGLDLAVDKQGKVWFIEANTKPDCVGLETIDRKLYRKYVEAKKLMGER